MVVKIQGKIWLYKGDSPWHFITIPIEDSEEINRNYKWPKRGFGSIPVNVTIGETTWKTSIFPEKDKTYLLPLKKEVRTKENVKEGDKVDVILEIL